jgi:hypothetical protein
VTELTAEQMAIVERYTAAKADLEGLGMVNVANITHEKRVALDVRYARARAEEMNARAAYERMIETMAKDLPKSFTAPTSVKVNSGYWKA